MRKDIFTIPNFITLVRVFVLPLMISAMMKEDYSTLAILVVVVALSDFLDGWSARKFNMVSDVGKILDPIADKICLFVLSLALYIYTDFPLWALVMLWGKDLLIVAGGSVIASKERIPITPNFWGKAAVAVEFIAFIVFAFNLKPLKADTLIVMTFFVVISFATYLSIFIQIILGKKNAEEIIATYSAYGLTKNARGRAKIMNYFIYVLCSGLFLWLIWLLWHYWGELF